MTLITSVEIVCVALVAVTSCERITGEDWRNISSQISFWWIIIKNKDWYPADVLICLGRVYGVLFNVNKLNSLLVGIVVVLWACFVCPFLMTPYPWNKTPLYSSPTFSHFPIKQLSLCHCWPLREYGKASIVASILPQSGGCDESFIPLRMPVCTSRPPLSPSYTLLLKQKMVISLSFSSLILNWLSHIHYDNYVIISLCHAEADEDRKGLWCHCSIYYFPGNSFFPLFISQFLIFIIV